MTASLANRDCVKAPFSCRILNPFWGSNFHVMVKAMYAYAKNLKAQVCHWGKIREYIVDTL